MVVRKHEIKEAAPAREAAKKSKAKSPQKKQELVIHDDDTLDGGIRIFDLKAIRKMR